MNSKSSIVKFIYNLYIPYRMKIINIIILLTLVSVVSLAMPFCNRELMDKGLIQLNYANILIYSTLMLLIVTFMIICNVIIENIRICILKGVEDSLQTTVFNKFMSIHINFYKKDDKFASLSKVFQDMNNIKTMTDASIFNSVAQFFSIIGGFLGLAMINVKMSLIIVFVIVIKYFIVKAAISQRKKLQIKYLHSSWKLHSFLGETIEAIASIRLFGLINNKENKYKKKYHDVLDIEASIARNTMINTSTEQFLSQLMISTIYIVGSRLVFSVDLTIGSLTAFIIYSTIVVNPISAFINIWYHFVEIAPSIRRLQDFLSSDEENKSGTLLGGCGKHHIVFKNVSFKFNADSEYTLQNINFDIFPNEKVAIIGNNGCGKSTLINLLLRFYQPTEGEIIIDNNNAYDYDINYYRSLFSTALQDTHLFNSSIEENIFLGLDVDEQNFRSILDITNLEGLFDSIRNKNSPIGDNGAFLSGGQRQKVALSRMLAHKRDIYVIDEATSNLDIVTETQIVEILGSLLKDKTVIVITHSPSVLKEVDKIILLKDGRISSIGDHDLLIKTDDYYNELLKQYSRANK